MRSLLQFTKKYFFIISFLILIAVNSYVLVRYDFSFSEGRSLFKIVISCIASVILYLAVLLCISKIRYKILLIIFGLLLTFCISLDFIFFILFDSRLAIGNLFAAFDTNSREAAGFFTTIGYKGVLIFVLELLITFLAVFQGARRMKEWGNKSFFIVVLSCFIITGLCCFLSSAVIPLDAKIIPYSFRYIQEKEKVKSYYKAERIIPEWVKPVDSADIPEKIFFVIGESSARSHYSLYGYNIPTSPFLDRLYKNDSLLRFDDVISPGHVTTYSLKISLTNSTPRDLEPFYTEKNVVEMAKARGYETLWISNDGELDSWQDDTGVYLNTIIHQIAHTSNQVAFLSKDDFDLLPLVEKYYKKGKKQVFFLHLIGSHFDYNDRYDDTDVQALTGYPRIASTAYDRTIHHTDRFLEKLYNRFKDDDKSMIIYFSDHGEIVNVGHGFIHQGIEQFEVPLVIIPFKYNKTRISDLVNKYRGAGQLLNNSNLSQMFYELIGYSILDSEVKKNVEDGKYLYGSDEKVYKISNVLEKKFVPEK